MAAAEYYNASAAALATPQHSPYNQSPHQQSPYHQSPFQRPHELQGSPVPQYNLPQGSQSTLQLPHRPPPYSLNQPEQKPAIHFDNAPPRHTRPSRPSSNRPSFSNQTLPSQHGQYLQPPPPHQSPHTQYGPPSIRPQVAAPPHMRPYMHGNHSEYTLNGGYASDPENRRRRRQRHRHSESKDEHDSSRDMTPRKVRSRSTAADGFLGAAGGGIIGDLIFPGLGTVGGAVAGWIGGKDYGKHRKHREDKRRQEQKDWEYEHRDRSHSRDRSHGHGHNGDHRSYPRRTSDY